MNAANLLTPKHRLLAEHAGVKFDEAEQARQAEVPLEGSERRWEDWLQHYYSHVCTAGFSERHVGLWEWIDALTPGVKPVANVEVWPRGGAKSSTGELGTVRVGAKLSRRFVLYVSETQPQADKHVQSVADLFERQEVGRAVNRYGASKGWTRDQLRTDNGFNVAAMGLDAAARGAKLGTFRPDLIIFDDIDGRHDTQATVKKKEEIITESLLPAGSADCAVLFLQNMVQEEGVVAKLATGRADFLYRRRVTVDVAVHGLETEVTETAEGERVYRIVAGAPTWEGQNLATCEGQINEWGLRAFMREAQNEVGGADGVFFKTSQIQRCFPDEVPPLVRICLAGDLAATENGGDHTVFVLMGKSANGRIYILAVIRGQWSSERVRTCLDVACDFYLPKWPSNIRKLHLPQDPAQAGKDQAEQLRSRYKKWGVLVESVSGKKWVRAEGFQEQVNKSNVWLVNQDLPEIFRPYRETLSYHAWQSEFVDVLRRFKEGEAEQDDDDVDASSDAFTEIDGKKRVLHSW